jgi:hypothetical protein
VLASVGWKEQQNKTNCKQKPGKDEEWEWEWDGEQLTFGAGLGLFVD